MCECNLDVFFKIIQAIASCISTGILILAFGFTKKQFKLAAQKDEREVTAHENNLIEKWTEQLKSPIHTRSIAAAEKMIHDGYELRLVHRALYTAMKNEFGSIYAFRIWEMDHVPPERHLAVSLKRKVLKRYKEDDKGQ